MRRSLCLVAIAALLTSCGSGPQDSTTIPHDSYPNSKAFLEGIKHYPYTASADRVSQITVGSRALHRCMTKDEIRALLGPPDYSDVAYGPKGPNARWLGYFWMYYISKRSDMVNLNDPRIEVFFDTTDRAHWIVPDGIEEASEIGAPDLVCTQVRLT